MAKVAIKCRNGGTDHSHGSVSEVRACYSGLDLPPAADRAAVPADGARTGHPNRGMGGLPSRRSYGPPVNGIGGWRADPVTEAQEARIARDLKVRGLAFRDGIGPVRKGPASDLISALAVQGPMSPAALRDFGLVRCLPVPVPSGSHVLPGAAGAGSGLENGPLRTVAPAVGAPYERQAAQRAGYPDVPEGHYAVASATGTNDLDFFRVDRPDSGRWAGRTFVKRVIGGRPSVPVRGTVARAALEAILSAGVDSARTLYGQEIGRCWHCNRHLTDETSRRLGIGPVCREGS